MVAFLETDQICYDFAINWAQERGDTQRIARLQEQGPPPYYGEGVAWKQVGYLKDTYAYMDQNPAIIGGFNTPRDLASPEYGLIGLAVTMSTRHLRWSRHITSCLMRRTKNWSGLSAPVTRLGQASRTSLWP
jgi:hypothetical protein